MDWCSARRFTRGPGTICDRSRRPSASTRHSWPPERMDFRHVDVFTERAYSGNGLVVFFGGVDRPRRELQAITAEMRQFESIFLGEREAAGAVSARIFTVE